MNGAQKQAIRHGKSRKGPWHMAKTIASGLGMTNSWVAEQGVLNLKTLRAKLAHFRETARYGSACRSGVGRRITNVGPSGIIVGDGTIAGERNPQAMQDKELYLLCPGAAKGRLLTLPQSVT